MKFEKFISLKERGLMESLNESATYDSFTIISMAEQLDGSEDGDVTESYADVLDTLSEDVNGDGVNEGLGEGLKWIWQTLRGLMRLTGLGKKYVKALVDQGANDMDYSRRRAAARKNGKDKTETEAMKSAHDTKNNELEERAKAIAEKMDEIASNDWLKAKVRRAKLEARIKKANILIKIAGKEEAKELGLQIKDLGADITSADNELKDYESKHEDDAKKVIRVKKEEMKEQIEDAGNKMDTINSNIEDAEDEDPVDPAKVIKLKEEKIKAKTDILKVKNTFNALEENEDDKYTVSKDEREIEEIHAEIAKLKEEPAVKDAGPEGKEGGEGEPTDAVAAAEKEGFSKTAPSEEEMKDYTEKTVQDAEGNDVKLYKKTVDGDKTPVDKKVDDKVPPVVDDKAKEEKKAALATEITGLDNQIKELEGKTEKTPEEEEKLVTLKADKTKKEEEKLKLDDSVETPTASGNIMKFADFVASRK